MKQYRKATIDDLIKDAVDNGREKKLKELASKKIKGRKISFLELKKLYFEEYYEDMIPRAKDKAPTFWERIEEL